MDSNPARHEQAMARWTFAGSLGVVLGPLLLSGLAFVGFGWRGVFIALAGLTVLVLFFVWQRFPKTPPDLQPLPHFADVWSGLRGAWAALRGGEALRWLVLLPFYDLMLDVLLGFLTLYFVDVARLTPGQAALGIAVWSGLGLLGDFLLIPLLEKVRGLDYLRLSVVIELLLFPAFLLVPDPLVKFVLLGLLGFFNSGWYAILKGRLYSAMPGQSGTVMTLDSLFSLLGTLLPFGIGLAAQVFGLQKAMWLLLLGPIAMLLGLPRHAAGGSSQMSPDA
jgi:FSR family fosmidomycin resistance protein-like MFS transporter